VSAAIHSQEKANMTYRCATVEDGQHLWSMVKQVGSLEQNTAYFYLLMSRMFDETCLVAEDSQGKRLGFVMALRPPRRPQSIFVWQVGVAPEARGKGVATGLLVQLLRQTQASYIEATVSPSNLASRALFSGLAQQLNCKCSIEPYFQEHHFPDDHPAEELFRIGPVDRPEEGNNIVDFRT